MGAYTSKNAITNYEGNTNEYFDNYPNIGDHCYFSSWQAEGSGPLGTPLPTISAPGAKIVAGVNHYHTASDNNSYFHNDRKKDLVVNGTSAYGVMQGTSMSAPCVSGIIALWLQACVEKGITATPDYIKEVMQNTWITDEWTNGTGNGAHGAKTFGTHGKIDALAGLRYILGITNPTPVITATTTELTFDTTTDTPETQTFEVTGVNLEGNIIATLNDENGVFSIDPSNITAEEAVNGKTVNVTFTPTEEGTYTATLTLTSDQAESVTVQLSATATKVVPEYFDVTISEVGLTTLYLDFPVAIPYETYRDLLGVYYICYTPQVGDSIVLWDAVSFTGNPQFDLPATYEKVNSETNVTETFAIEWDTSSINKGILRVAGITNAIKKVAVDGQAKELNDVYNVQGQLVKKNAQSLVGLPKGIYFWQGRKVVVK